MKINIETSTYTPMDHRTTACLPSDKPPKIRVRPLFNNGQIEILCFKAVLFQALFSKAKQVIV